MSENKPAPMVQPFAWLYQTKAGVRVLHIAGDCNEEALKADIEAARKYPGAHSVTELYTAAPAPVAQLPEDFLDWARKRLTRERAELVGFVAIGNELHRAATYDRWIAALNATLTTGT